MNERILKKRLKKLDDIALLDVVTHVAPGQILFYASQELHARSNRDPDSFKIYVVHHRHFHSRQTALRRLTTDRTYRELMRRGGFR